MSCNVQYMLGDKDRVATQVAKEGLLQELQTIAPDIYRHGRLSSGTKRRCHLYTHDLSVPFSVSSGQFHMRALLPPT